MVAMNKIKAGDVVGLKSGGPAMTATWVNDDQVGCAWFVGGDIKQHTFSEEALEVLSAPKRGASSYQG
jgi:uncharacterized protein YodC (DUF2158 family)